MKLDAFLQHEISRRQFLNKSAMNAAGVAAGMVGLASTVAKASPSEKVSLGVIGVRNQGTVLATTLAKLADTNIVALCDVDESQTAKASAIVAEIQGQPPRLESDFRRILDNPSIDAVVIAAPDHWHAIMTILACQAGKDVYVEKPASQTIVEGERMVAAARKSGRIVQTGLQQRSSDHFISAIEYVRSGRLGKVAMAKAWTVHRRKPIGVKQDANPPQGVDYDAWLGPAPERAFNPNRFHYNWRWFWDYGTGELGNWGAHMLDVARWGIGAGLPTRVSAMGGKHYFQDDQETPDSLVVCYEYPEQSIVWEHRLWSSHPMEGRSAAVAFYGEDGTLILDRGGWKVYGQSEPAVSPPENDSDAHLRNFVDCVKSRRQPRANIEVGHQSSVLCHLGNIAYRLGRDVSFDPIRMNFSRDDDANALLGREYRPKWDLPTV